MKNYYVLLLFILLSMPLFAQQDKPSYDGEYQIRPGFNIVISTEGDTLYVQATNKPKETLIEVNETVFKIESINGTIDFSLTAEKDVVIVKMYGQTIHAPKLPLTEEKESWEEIEIHENDLKIFEGEYELNDKAKFSVSIEEEGLFVQLTGQPDFQVYPFAKNKFFYKVVEASLEFVKNDDGIVEYLLLYQNGVIVQANKL